jgi:hypothetical protein
MRKTTSPSGKSFRYKRCDAQEIIIYPSDDEDKDQNKTAIVITPFTEELVRQAIMQKCKILMGASRDNPPAGSLGYLLRSVNQSPQQLSYLAGIFRDEGFCKIEKEGKAYVLIHRRS